MDHHVNSWVSMISNNSPPPSSPLCDEHKSQISDSLGSECPDSSMQDSLNSPVDFSKEVEQCYSELLLPPSLRAAPESQRMAIAWAYEAYNVLESERTIMQHRRRQMIFEARSYQLQEEEKLSSAQTIMRDVQQLINLSLSKVSASGFVPERQHPPWSSPHGRNNLPSLSKASAHADSRCVDRAMPTHIAFTPKLVGK